MAEAPLAPPFGLVGVRRVFAIAAAALALTSFFVAMGFPYDRLLPRAEDLASAALGVPVSIGRVGLGFTWRAPELRAWDVDATLSDGRRLHLDRVRVRPAWSLAWLRGAPAIGLALRSPVGELDGTAILGDAPGFRGELRDVHLGELPIAALASGVNLDGRARATIDLTLTGEGPVGSVQLDAEQGSITLPVLPIGIPYDTLHGDVELGGEQRAKIGALEAKGPLVSLSASGTVGNAPIAEAAPLALRAKLIVADPSARNLLMSQGVQLDANGQAEVDVGGTLGEPLLSGRGRGRTP